MQNKIQQIFFDFAKFALELAVLNTPFYWETIHLIGWQYVNKQSQDFRHHQNGNFWVNLFSEW